MKNNNLLIKASKKVALAVLAASMLVSPCAAIPVSAEIIEGQWETTYTGEDVPAHIRECEGEGISVTKRKMYNDEGWMSYTNAAQGRFPSGVQWYLYGTNEDGTEYLADEIWVYYDLSGGRRERAWYEKGVQIKVEQLESVKEEDSNSGSSDSSDSSTDSSTDNSSNSGSDSTGSDTTTDNGNTSGDSSNSGTEEEKESIWGEYPENGWYIERGEKYWYENGVRQGVKLHDDSSAIDMSYRGKEIYDPETDAWYWCDNVEYGAIAVNKDVYQDSYAGGFADNADGTGKWVRYDEKGHMIKGWDETEDGLYYFDLKTGAMAKGIVQIGEYECRFDSETGIFVSKEKCDAPLNGWYEKDGEKYWYEDGVRQGVRCNADGSINESFRGKEIYDPVSDAWYWCDGVQGGAVARNKDVYQDSFAGLGWGDSGTTDKDGKRSYGKWVRYDENGHMVKGWQTTEDGVYYFNLETGAMAKGLCIPHTDLNGVENTDMYHEFVWETGKYTYKTISVAEHEAYWDSVTAGGTIIDLDKK